MRRDSAPRRWMAFPAEYSGGMPDAWEDEPGQDHGPDAGERLISLGYSCGPCGADGINGAEPRRLSRHSSGITGLPWMESSVRRPGAFAGVIIIALSRPRGAENSVAYFV